MPSDRVIVVYRLRVPAGRAAERARMLALEQSIEMPAEAVIDQRVADHVIARVEQLAAQDDGSHLATVSLSAESIGEDAGQLLNMLFGNSALQPDVEVVDLELPAALARAFGGPGLGVAGIRRLTGAAGRPLSCTALKPIGSSAAQLAALCTTFTRAGIDLIKDDHGWADQASSPFAQRLPACQRAVDAANAQRAGARTIYAPSLYGDCTQMLRQIDLARAHGVRAALVAPMICGVATLARLRRAHPDFALIAHPALACAGIAPPLLLGKLFRLFGADAVIFPNHGGRFAWSRELCQSIARNLRAPWHELAASLPVPAGGMSVERVAELRRDYGADCALLIGGSLLIARERLAERCRAFVEAVAASERVPA